jgi:DNA sulfur modification protein DndE
MTWQVFGGEHAELYLALLIERMHNDGVELSERELSKQFRIHLHRGIGYLATPGFIQDIAGLASTIEQTVQVA